VLCIATVGVVGVGTASAGKPDEGWRCEAEIRNNARTDYQVTRAEKGNGDQWDPDPRGLRIGSNNTVSLAAQDPPPGACRLEIGLSPPKSTDGEAITLSLARVKGRVAASCAAADVDFRCVASDPRVDDKTVGATFTISNR
jgi:hypothetical protein